MKYVISIGIDNTIGLPPLTSAASGAEEVEKWAKSQGYKTILFTDKGGETVSLNEIFSEIYQIVQERACEQLIVFFSGHGVLKSPGQEIWLLPNAKINPNEAINLAGSIDNARTSAIPYIVFISDACRILPDDLQLTGNGSVIFSIEDDINEDCVIDVLYATRPGSPANEFSSKKNSKKFGLFTQSILEILNGTYPELIWSESGSVECLTNYYDADNLELDRDYKQLTNQEWTINAINIKNPLQSLVNKKASEINITLNQNPQLIIEHQDPKPYLSKFDDNTAKQLLLNINSETKSLMKVNSDISEEIQKTLDFELKPTNEYSESFKTIMGGFEPVSDLYNADGIKSSFARNSEKILKATGKDSFETQTGFTIVGNNIAHVILGANVGNERFIENSNEQVRIYQSDGVSSALIVLENGQSIPLAVLKGYIGTVIFDKNRLLTVNYTPSRNNYKYEIFSANEKEISSVRAFVASAANEGFDYQKKFENILYKNGEVRHDNPGSFLRRQKALDPSLGLYAVYAYIQAGKANDVKSVYRHMRFDMNNYMLFDVAMLSSESGWSDNTLAPFCPMLSLGWAYRQRFEAYLHPQIKEASNYLVPNLWTTFGKKGTEYITDLFKKDVIK